MGCIPQGKQFNTFQNDLYSGNLALSGFLPSKDCDEPRPLVYQAEDDPNNASGFTWKVVLIGYGCGTVFELLWDLLCFLLGNQNGLSELLEEEDIKMQKRRKMNQ